MANSLFSIGLSGLAAAQAGLATTGHNIGNVNTPGFSRQETLQASAFPQFAGGSFYGRGVDVAGVRRIYSDYLAAQSLSLRSQSSELEALATELGQLDDLFGDPASGLSPALQDFFAGVNALAAHPADMPSRQSMLAAARALVARFHMLDDHMAGLRSAADDQVESAVGEVNTLAAQIAGLNRRIVEITSASINGQQPNDLLDQRDLAVARLNDLIGARAVPQGDGTHNVFLASGQALVVGQDSYRLQALADTQDPRRVQIALELGGGASLRLSSATVSGGKLAGVLAYRDGPLGEAQNELGRIAAVLADAFNAQHGLGVDLAGTAGGDFFAMPTPAWVGASTNTGTATLSLGVANAGALTASDYAVRYDGTTWTIERLADDTTSSFATLPQTIDGVTFGLAGGTAAAGDSFLVQPTRYAARDIGVLISDPAKVAAAAPIVASASTANTGTARISNGAVTAAYPASPLATPVTLTYNAGASMLSGFPAAQPVTVMAGGVSTTYAAGAPVPYTAGATFAFGGVEFTLTGAPANGDTFTLAPNTGGIGDNRNAQLLAGLASRNLVAGTATFAGALGQLVANIGSATHEAQLEQQAQAALHAQTERAMQAVSGVNLDEEAANLQRFQQAYQAAGQVMRIASSLFDTILDINR